MLQTAGAAKITAWASNKKEMNAKPKNYCSKMLCYWAYIDIGITDKPFSFLCYPAVF
jgi:hypothetical protein